eukprot:COSAG01_NODE_34_length_34978_cov_45.798475_24_plen_116_part_00
MLIVLFMHTRGRMKGYIGGPPQGSHAARSGMPVSSAAEACGYPTAVQCISGDHQRLPGQSEGEGWGLARVWHVVCTGLECLEASVRVRVIGRGGILYVTAVTYLLSSYFILIHFL